LKKYRMEPVTMTVRIRKAVYSDIEKIGEIESGGNGLWNTMQFLEELKLSFSTIMVLEEKGEVAGFVVCWRVADHVQLNNIGIKRELQRQGLGTLLLRHIMDNVFPKGSPAVKIILEVSSSNMAAFQFYRKNGFVETGRRKNYYKDGDAILMERPIA
jgi:ribosomal-protein-alanine N-acetyltransferase